MEAKAANAIFEEKIWQYMEKCYALLHLNGDDVAMEDILAILNWNGVRL